MKNITKEQRDKWSIWATLYTSNGKCFWRSTDSNRRNVSNDSQLCEWYDVWHSLYAAGTSAKFILDLVMSKTRSRRNCDAIFTKTDRSTSCFAKRYNYVSFSPARTTIPKQKIEITSPIQSSNLIRLKELKFDSSRNNFRETKYVCPRTTKQAAYILSTTFWIHSHP